MTIDITRYLPDSTAPHEAYTAAWQMCIYLYPYRDNPAAAEALEVALSFCLAHEDGTATASNYADAESLFFDVRRVAA